MKEHLIEEMKPIIELAKNGVFKAAELAREQFPLVVTEIYRWEFTYNLIIGILGIVLGVVTYKFSKHCMKKADWRYGGNGWAISCLIGGGCGAMLSISAIARFAICIKILVAPRLFLLSYLSDLVKGG